MIRDKVPLWRKVDGDTGLCICQIILVVCFILLNLVLIFFYNKLISFVVHFILTVRNRNNIMHIVLTEHG